MSSELRRSKRRRVTVCKASKSEPFLFATEPKQKGSDVRMHHVCRITFRSRKTMAIINIADVCSDISAAKRMAVDGSM